MIINKWIDMDDVIKKLEKIREEIKKARDIAYEAPEIDMKNINPDEVKKLDDAMFEIFRIVNNLYNNY